MTPDNPSSNTQKLPLLAKIRSYVRREGRITPSQLTAIKSLWARYGIEPSDLPLDFDALFNRKAARILEIGFGMGQSLLEMAVRQPEHDFLGIEVHRPGVGSLLAGLAKENVSNVRLLCADAVEVLEQRVPDASVAGINLFFPDPWPKRRHQKRRIVQPPFVDLIARKLVKGGYFHIATDWEDYALHIETIMGQSQCFQPNTTEVTTHIHPLERPLTKFELRGQRLGHAIWDFVFIKI